MRRSKVYFRLDEIIFWKEFTTNQSLLLNLFSFGQK